MRGEFEWDDDKLARNLAERGIHFSEAAGIDWSTAQTFIDDRIDYGEERFITRGLIGARLHILVYVLRGDRMRIISLRKANARERRNYARETGYTLGSS